MDFNMLYCLTSEAILSRNPEKSNKEVETCMKIIVAIYRRKRI